MAVDIDKILREGFELTDQQLILDYSKAFISFSNVDGYANSEHIYIGTEEIPFKERHPEYQKLFIYEFLTGR